MQNTAEPTTTLSVRKATILEKRVVFKLVNTNKNLGVLMLDKTIVA
jgi:hypothetical protein